LIQQLDSVLINDQKYRLQMDSVEKANKNDPVKMSPFYKSWHDADSANLVIVTSIIDKYGWLGPDVLGDEGSSTLFLVIQHSDLKTQEKYLPLMKEAVKKGDAVPAELALLIDRVEMRNGRPQIYGSQLIRDNESDGHKFYQIMDEKNVNKRREEVGLQPLEEYAKYFGLEYQVPEK
jgi:hypothetical protein